MTTSHPLDHLRSELEADARFRNVQVMVLPTPATPAPDHVLHVLTALEATLAAGPGPLLVVSDALAAGALPGPHGGAGAGTHLATDASPVGLAMLAAEQRALAAARAGTPVRVLRVFGLFGESGADPIQWALDAVRSGASPVPFRAPLLHVTDALDAIAQLLHGPPPASARVEVLAGPEIVHSDTLVSHVAALLGRPAPPPHPRTPRLGWAGRSCHPVSGPGWRQRVAEALARRGEPTQPVPSVPPPLVPSIHPRLAPDLTLNARLFDILCRRQLSNCGPNARHLEERIATLTGARHVVAVGSGSAALLVAARAMNCSGTAIVPSFTFLATAAAAVHSGLTPVFCDIDPTTWTLDPHHLQRLVEQHPDVSLVLPVTTFGVPPDLSEIDAIAASVGARVLHDACHAFGSTVSGTSVLGLPGVHTLSMHATKILSAVEGGLVCTDDEALAQEVRQRANYGFSGGDRRQSLPAFNFHFDEVRAELAHHSLDHATDALALRAEQARRLRDAAEGFQVQAQPDGVRSGFQEVGVAFPHGPATDAPVWQSRLRALGVEGRRYFHPPLHTLQRFTDPSTALPVTDDLCRRILCMPIHPWMPEAQLQAVEAALRALPRPGP
jgi:dTDP-4-amino-4,6-dideoxygalactose transaminase